MTPLDFFMGCSGDNNKRQFKKFGTRLRDELKPLKTFENTKQRLRNARLQALNSKNF